MSGLFSYRQQSDPWFRIGRLEVTTVMFAVLLVVASIVPWVITGGLWTTMTYYNPSLLAGGQLWRLISWPFAEGLSQTLWSVLTIFMLWYFGTALEGQIGRKSMAGLLVGIWATLTATYSLTAVLFSSSSALVGVGMIQFMVLLLWIAEYPSMRFLFNIPAWAFGAVIVGLQLLVLLANRDYAGLISLLLSLMLVAIAGRRAGLLSEYAWIPGRPTPRKPKAPKVPRAQAKQAERRSSDRERLDQLLDQINDKGINSLTDSQRKELLKLRDRLRKT
jgi:hypothetical protein